ncbi:hypothetical protein [Brevundimonas sp.]|uniref:hypothetical protein n=1 Tax=Brevundimonas sp. TaxID=1871086 RepID=UPI00262C3A24|nr:hypothetical protein [Brevundimonas sp.]
MPKPRIDYKAAERLILVMIYDAFIKDRPMAFSAAKIRKQLPIPLNIIRVTLEKLEDDSLIDETQRSVQRPVGLMRDQFATTWVGTDEFTLTEEGRARVEKMPDDQYDLILAALGAEPAALVLSESAEQRALDTPDKWEPLPIETGDAELAQVKARLTDLVETVEKDNGYRSSAPDERADVLAALGAARKILDDASSFTYSHLVAYVFTPLEKLSRRFDPQTVIGSAARLFWDAVKGWVKKKIGIGLDNIFDL